MTVQTDSPTSLAVARRANVDRRRLVIQGPDREFLPAALEILETPPSPVRLWLILVICTFFAAALCWSYVSRIDIIAVAQGKLQPTGRIKFIQPLETSRVLKTLVENGQSVKAGDVLVELDPADATADLSETAADLESYRAEAIRRQAAIDSAKRGDLGPQLNLEWPAAIPSAIRQREERVYAADLTDLGAHLASLQAQRDQKEAERQRLTAMIAAEQELISTHQERVSMTSMLFSHQVGSRAELLDQTEKLQEQKTSLAQQQGELAEANANLIVLGKDMRRAYETFVADNAQKLAAAERQVGELTEKRIKAQARLDHMALKSPIDGTVQASTLTTVGQIVTSGQELMRIVPEGAQLEVECYLPNKDIGFVKEGDHAIIKIESFPFTRYGTVDAVVTRVARDAIPEPDAEEAEKDGTRNPHALTAAGAQRTQNLVFPVTLRPSRPTIGADGVAVPLGAGMAVTAEIQTGRRRILEYIFSPVVKITSEAMKER
ncbi:MAG: HlyD family type I secretion periplasmic adaptor subunit [Alphaproteobacteria bacterium]|nr:HlyD family type I secretion periplasmic adaptor subunit [Alphaproteobacteria bacterium]